MNTNISQRRFDALQKRLNALKEECRRTRLAWMDESRRVEELRTRLRACHLDSSTEP